ncbi:ABC transporter permease [Rhodonellum psychrophilum GCM71 = DSM 17998]|uniref:ABC transporter permease n=2 Tax=Rhodonellum TaxID=336827 RepID=U5C516_9BACT|nr:MULTISPECIES: ABC transporter permease [Rhodonellum]ERM84879.1 ABC transporter permease [Rhodonellum psychrophilum GCM71 = DSM 17998]SDY72624.1 ABC-2 type transport system permease protein [Rhodonellum ikkaensis]
MGKIFLVIQREYFSRVKKRSFLLATILTPLIFPAIMGLFLWISVGEKDGFSLRIIEVVDENDLFFLESSEQYAFSFSKISREEGKLMVQEGERFGFLYIPKIELSKPAGIVYFGEKNPSMSLISTLESSLKRTIEEQRLYQSGIDPNVIDAFRTKVSIQSVTLDNAGEEKISDATVNYGIGFFAGIMIYVFIFVYGNQIMQGVIEEKSSRIVEILVSSIKPFQLMLGKIIGIGAVGLTQFLIWMLLIGTITSIVMGYFGLQMPQQQAMEMANPELGLLMDDSFDSNNIIQVLQGIDFVKITLMFLFYFIGGYLLYGAFFAAIGAAVDSPSDAQQFMLPVTIPLIIAYLGLFIFVLDDPNSRVSFWLSVIPFTSPIAMMGRASYGVPAFDLILSMGFLVLAFLFTTWFAGKIYRIGILIHGAKVNYKTLWKWITTS